jgi:5-methylcytosine-specific restriction endonuclease McrA
MIGDIKILFSLYKQKHLHFIHVDFKFYKRWKWVIRLIMMFNPNYKGCEIFRKKYKIHTNFVVIGLKWNGKNVKRRTSGFAKDFVANNNNPECIYCECNLSNDNCTSDHIVPISNNGNNCQVNLIVCCKDCNNERGNMEFTKYLKIKNKKYKKDKYIFI